MANGDLTIELDKKDYERMQKMLSQLSEVDKKATIQRALSAGAKLMQAAGKSNLAQRNKVHTGNLKKSFGLRVMKKKAYALAGFKRPGGAHVHLIDHGTAKRWTSRGYYRGSVSKGSPNTGSRFWSDAVKTQGPAAMNKVMDAIYRSLDEITRRN